MAQKDRANLCDVIESRPGWKVLKDPVLQKVPSLFVARCHSPRSCLANRHMASLISMFVHGVVVLSFCGCVARACMRVLFPSSVRRSNEHLLQVAFFFPGATAARAMSQPSSGQHGNAGPPWVQRTYRAVNDEAERRLPGADLRGGAPKWHFAESPNQPGARPRCPDIRRR